MLLHLIGAEQLRPQRRLVTGVVSPQAPSRKARLQAAQRIADRMTAQVHRIRTPGPNPVSAETENRLRTISAHFPICVRGLNEMAILRVDVGVHVYDCHTVFGRSHPLYFLPGYRRTVSARGRTPIGENGPRANPDCSSSFRIVMGHDGKTPIIETSRKTRRIRCFRSAETLRPAGAIGQGGE